VSELVNQTTLSDFKARRPDRQPPEDDTRAAPARTARLARPASGDTRERVDRGRLRARRATALAVVALALAVAVAAFALLRSTGGEAPAADVQAVVEAASAGTMRVTTRAADGRASGSGWVLDAHDGLVVTNLHVVNGGERFSVNLDGAELDAELVGASPCEDIALLQFAEADRDGLRALALGRQRDVRQGEPVVAIGYPANGADAGDSRRRPASSPSPRRACARPPLRRPTSTTSSRPTPRSTPATPGGRCSTSTST
jgi:S1-C subfamily serine protease